MILGKRLINTGVEAACTTDTADVFGDSSGVALYTLDYDASEAGGLDGSPTDVEFGVGGQINYGARFNGTSSIIQDVLGSGFTYAGKTMTFSAWIYVTDNTNDNVIIGDGFTTVAGGWAIATGYGAAPNQRLSFSIASSAVGGVQQTYSSVSIADNTWTHIAVSVNFSAIATNSSIKMYINGTEDTSLTDGITTSFVENTLYNSSIGGTWNGAAGRLFAGSIDQVRIFNKALNQTEIDALYAETACEYTCTTDTVDYPTTNVAYYKLDNDATDEVGSYDGTENNISYTFGRFGQAAIFNGSSSYVQTSLSLANTAGVSTSFWFQADTVGSTNIALYFNNNGGRIDININGTGSNSATVSSNVISVNSTTAIIGWNHLAIVYTGWASSYTPAAFGGAISAAVYLNGSLIGTVSPTPYGQTDGLRIGRSGGSYYFDGKIDQVRIFSSALDSTQVTQLYEEKPCADTSTFKTVLWDGNGGTQYISNLGFEPDFVWIKKRGNDTKSHRLFDSVRGPNNVIYSNLTNAADTPTNELTSFDANGFTLGNASAVNDSDSNDSFVAWCWKAGGDAVNIAVNSITGSTPSVASDVSANQDTGFSIVKYTGNGTSGATIGHGLSSAPEFSIIKKLDTVGYSGGNWVIGYGSYNTDLYLNSTAAAGTNNYFWNAAPTSTVLEVKNDWFVNYSGAGYISYNFHSVSGVSKVGSYVGDGTDDFSKQITGLGFDPSFVMVKNTTSSGSNWEIIDVRRGDGQNLYANENYYENANSPTSYGTGNLITDGFAVRRGTVSTSVHWNKSGDTFIYLAFA